MCKYVELIKISASRHDNLTIKIIMHSLSVVLSIITHIIDTSMGLNIPPDDWEKSVIPIPKNKNPVQYKIVRPIIMIPVLCKLLENNLQLSLYNSKFNLLPNTQSGFSIGYIFLPWITINFFLGLLDFSKAFDTLNNHDLLFVILHHTGLASDALKCFIVIFQIEEFIKIDNALPVLLDLRCGVPQRPLLGPLLFYL